MHVKHTIGAYLPFHSHFHIVGWNHNLSTQPACTTIELSLEMCSASALPSSIMHVIYT